MNGVLVAELAIFFQFDSIRVVLLILHIVVVALFALGAGKRYTRSRSCSHISNSFRLW